MGATDVQTLQDTRINESGDCRKEAAGRKTEFLSAKAKTRIGLWIVFWPRTDKLVFITIMIIIVFVTTITIC